MAISLSLNIAACCLKVEEFDSVVHMCSSVLSVSPSNVKAHFRRAIAFKNLRSLEAARKDLLKSLEVEPSNKGIMRELEAINLDKKGKRKVRDGLKFTPLREPISPKHEDHLLKSPK